jgi:hypothetical protein
MLGPGNIVNVNFGTGIFTFPPGLAGFYGKLRRRFSGILPAKGTKKLRKAVCFIGKFRDTMSGQIQYGYGYIGSFFIGA